jgi:hypothetical protein
MLARTGRPPELPDRRKVEVYVTGREQGAIDRAARQAQLSRSAWVRGLVLVALRERRDTTRP